MNFSVLISIYHKENVDYFNRAIYSIWDEQTVKPDDIVLVEDGVLTEDLYRAIKIWKEKLGDKLNIVSLKENKGLGDALNIGLRYCKYEYVARMDTDDIALPNRFEKQLEIFNTTDIDICSAWISEFEEDENFIYACRRLPEVHQNIMAFSKKRNPINHPVVMYKKSMAIAAGGYKKMLLFEDYYLWIRMFRIGAKFYNIQEVLLKMRAGNEQLTRRSGWDYAKKEIIFQNEIFKMGYLNFHEYVRNIFIRTLVRVAPRRIIKQIYQKLRE